MYDYFEYPAPVFRRGLWLKGVKGVFARLHETFI